MLAKKKFLGMQKFDNMQINKRKCVNSSDVRVLLLMDAITVAFLLDLEVIHLINIYLCRTAYAESKSSNI